MIDANISVIGSVNFDGIDNAETRIIDPITARWTERTRSTLGSQQAPAKLPNQKYVRTGKIRNWETKRLAPGAYEFANTARQHGRYYGIYVLGNADGDRRNTRKHNQQAWMHKGRWYIAFDIIEKESEKLPGELAQGFADNWR